MRALFALIISLAVSPFALAHPAHPTETTYLGNEGIMVGDGDTTILFDPLFPNGFGTYQLVPEEVRLALLARTTPGVDRSSSKNTSRLSGIFPSWRKITTFSRS